MDLVSVIVPVYNVEKYIRECLDSITGQTYTNLEIILVDDGSPDNSGEICEEYARKDSRITVCHKENGGLSDARNYGIARANGDFMTFVDSDDIIKPNLTETLLGLIHKYDADVSSAPFMRFTDSYEIMNASQKEIHTGCVSSYEALRELLYHNRIFYTITCGKIYRRGLFDGILFPEGLYYEDVPTIYRTFVRAGRIAFTDEPLYGWRVNMNSIMHTAYSPKMLSCITVSRQIFSGVTGKYPELTQAASSIAFNINRSAYLNLPYNRKEERRKVWEEVRKYRYAVLTDKNARKLERIMALASYSGPAMFYLLSGLFRLYHSAR